MFSNPLDAVIYNNLVCDDNIENDDEISEFSSMLNQEICNLRINRKNLSLFFQPIDIIKNEIRKLRLIHIRRKFNSLVASDLFKHLYAAKTFDDTMEFAATRKYYLVKQFAHDNISTISKCKK